MKDFRISFLVTAICLALAGWWGQSNGQGILPTLWLVLVLGVLEVSLSFDNAVVNAGVLRYMSEFWRKLFLTVGILIAVFGMRLLFPILIVSVATGSGFGDVVRMALEKPDEYAKVLTSHYPQIAAFGGMFLLLVSASFIFDDEREDFGWAGGEVACADRQGGCGCGDRRDVRAALHEAVRAGRDIPLRAALRCLRDPAVPRG
jgi:hypothetical protein